MAEDNQNETNKQSEAPSEGQKKTVKIVLIVVGVLILLGIIGTLLLGYIGARIGTSILDQATNGDVTVSEDGVTIEGEDGDFATSQELPRDFPEAVPVYEPSEIGGSSRASQQGEVYWTVSLSTEDSADEVYDFYVNALGGGDWETESTFEVDNMSNISATNETEGLNATASVMHEGNGDTTTAITLTVIQTEEQ